MKSATVVTLALILIFHGPPPARSQETPTSLTRGEYQCQNAFGRSLIALSNGTGACLAACRSTPGRRCSTSFPDPITRDCLDRARAAAEVRVLRQCAGADCPECYDGGDCSDYSQSAFSQTVFDVDSGLSTLFCDDSFSADGLTRAEQRCQQGLARAGGRFAESLEHCFDNCQQAVHRGAMGFSSCDSAFLDAPRFDARTQHCVDKARARLLSSCTAHCADPPECLGYSCPAAAAAVESEAIGLAPATYCQEPGVCGDGQITGAETCDESATPTGCPVGTFCSGCHQCIPRCGDGLVVAGEPCDASAPHSGCGPGFICQFCSFCEEECGDGVHESDEACERNDASSCALGTACDATCHACTPTASATEDFGEDCFTAFDIWSFDVSAGQNVVVRADNVTPATAADGLEIFGNCTNGQFFSSFQGVPCAVPGPFFYCPAATFLVESDATCSVTVEPIFCEQGPQEYRLDVSGTDLTLVTDDGEPASPSGAFISATARPSLH